MAGCYGNSFEDRYFEQKLMDYLDDYWVCERCGQEDYDEDIEGCLYCQKEDEDGESNDND